ncbi:zinc finger protein 135-like [Prorops nasuta]|uniref:zinc finger protein 135-like n=1 Tax=Prorops nasuta TaxID=863751 RepID=UPI0034CE0269
MDLKNQKPIMSFDRNICRVCLWSDPSNQCIFQNTLNLLKKIKLCCGIEISVDDELPIGMCINCVSKVNAAYELRLQCQATDFKLRKMYDKPLNTNQNLDTCILKDQFSQTETSFDSYKTLTELSKINSCNKLCKSRNSISLVNDKIQNKVSCNSSKSIDIKNISKTTIDKKNELKNLESDKLGCKKDSYRAKRLTMFKRITSMESLRSFKERQRQYIKKGMSIKYDVTDKRDSATSCIHLSNLTEKILNKLEPHKCTICNKCFNSKILLEQHALTHNDKKYNCDICSKQFLKLARFLEHAKIHTKKDTSELVQCQICDKTFRKVDTMVRHLNIHKHVNPKEVYFILKEIRDKRKLKNTLEEYNIKQAELDVGRSCIMQLEETCFNEENSLNDLKQPIADNLKEHTSVSVMNSNYNSDLNKINSELHYCCNYCSKSFTNKKSLQRHLLMHGSKKYACIVCSMKFFREERLKSHKSKHGHNGNKERFEPQPPPDDKTAIKLINIWMREELDSDNEGKSFPCNICGKSYDAKKSLLKHQQKIHGIEESNCDNCGKVCKCNNKEMNMDKEKHYVCSTCNKTFQKEVRYQKHIRMHERAKEQQDTNFKRFLCHICSKTFRQNTGLMFHMRTHTGYKPHVCKYCGRGFTSNSNCINHERTHTGDRPFVCHFCSAAFAKSCTLKAHITTHTGEANYHCKTCGKAFRRLKYLKEHRFTHTGEKPYACKICGTAYSHSGSLFVHEKKCKAQYVSYQMSSLTSTENYAQHQSVTSDSGAVIAPIVSSQLNHIDTVLGVEPNKNYMERVQRNIHSASNIVTSGTSHLHIDTESPKVTSTIRNLTAVGEIFHP